MADQTPLQIVTVESTTCFMKAMEKADFDEGVITELIGASE